MRDKPKTLEEWLLESKIYNLSYSDKSTFNNCWNAGVEATRQEMQAEIEKRDARIETLENTLRFVIDGSKSLNQMPAIRGCFTGEIETLEAILSEKELNQGSKNE